MFFTKLRERLLLVLLVLLVLPTLLFPVAMRLFLQEMIRGCCHSTK